MCCRKCGPGKSDNVLVIPYFVYTKPGYNDLIYTFFTCRCNTKLIHLHILYSLRIHLHTVLHIHIFFLLFCKSIHILSYMHSLFFGVLVHIWIHCLTYSRSVPFRGFQVPSMWLSVEGSVQWGSQTLSDTQFL